MVYSVNFLSLVYTVETKLGDNMQALNMKFCALVRVVFPSCMY